MGGILKIQFAALIIITICSNVHAQWALIHVDANQTYYDLQMYNHGDSLMVSGTVGVSASPGYKKINTTTLSGVERPISSYPIVINEVSDTSSWLFSNSGKLFHSNSEFETIQQITTSNFSTSLILADMIFFNDTTGLIAEHSPMISKLFRTTNRGNSWTQIGALDNVGGYRFSTDGDSTFCVSFNGAFVSDDQGLTWNWNFEQNGGNYFFLDLHKKGKDMIFVGQGTDTQQGTNYGVISISRDYGVTWEYKRHDHMLLFDDIEMVSDSIGYAVGAAQTGMTYIYKTIDVGETWHPQGYFTNPTGYTRFFRIDCLNPDTCYVCGTEGKIARTYNGGGPFLDVSVEELAHSIELRLFPNPAQDHFTISSSEKIKEYKVLDINGRILIHQTTAGYSIEVHTATLSAGVYFIQIYTVEGVVTKKFEKVNNQSY